MKQILSIMAIIALFSVGATDVVYGSSAKKAKSKAVLSAPDKAIIHNCASCHSLSKEEASDILKGLGEVTEVKMSPVKGLYEVTVQQGDRRAVAYLDFSKKLLVPGPIFDTVTKSSLTPPPVDLPKILSKKEVDAIPLTDSIVMGNTSGKKRLIVFTDPDCSFCARLHVELKKLVVLEPDLVIYLKMYPLKMHPKAHDKARVILGAGANGLEMLEKAFSGQPLPEPGKGDPDKPVEDSVSLAESIGIHSTPTLIFPDGTVLSGARDAATLRIMLDEKK